MEKGEGQVVNDINGLGNIRNVVYAANSLCFRFVDL